MITLALDLGGTTGVAIAYDSGQVETFTLRVARKEEGARSYGAAARLWHHLQELSLDAKIGRIVFEETFAQGHARFMLGALESTVGLFAQLADIPWTRVNPPTWKKRVVGDGRATREQYWVYATTRWQRDIPTHDEAAALCLLEYAGIQPGMTSDGNEA